MERMLQEMLSDYRQGWWLAVNQGDEFDRGVAAGTIAARLDQHDKHFGAINGSIAHVGEEMHRVALALQRLADQAVSRDEAAKLVADALQKANDARVDQATERFLPWQHTAVLLGGVSAFLTVATWIILHFNS